MTMITTRDGVKLHVEEAGEGTPILFIHEFGGNHASWEPQLRYFSRRHRCVTYAARGYPPSDVPESVDAYSQAIAADDAVAVLDALKIDKAHIVGLSMGGFCTVHFGLRTPQRALSLTVAARAYRGASRLAERPVISARRLQDIHTPIMTSDALMTAQASSPALRLRSATASFVIADVMTIPLPISIRTWDVVVPFLTSTILPLSWLRALSLFIVHSCQESSFQHNLKEPF